MKILSDPAVLGLLLTVTSIMLSLAITMLGWIVVRVNGVSRKVDTITTSIHTELTGQINRVHDRIDIEIKTLKEITISKDVCNLKEQHMEQLFNHFIEAISDLKAWRKEDVQDKETMKEQVAAIKADVEVLRTRWEFIENQKADDTRS